MFSKILTKKIQVLYEKQFTGFIRVSDATERQWHLYFLLGRIVWAQSGFHDLRRWQRYVSLHSPAFFNQVSQPVSLYYEYWNYVSIVKLVKRKQFSRDVFSKIVECYIAEVLFDIIQTGSINYPKTGELLMEAEPRNASQMPFLMLESLQSLDRAKQEWQRWKQVGLAKISPDCTPIIKNPQALKNHLPASTFQTLSSFANRGTPLRDISIESKQPIIPIAKSILPYVADQLISLTTLPDLVDNVTHGFHLELAPPQKETKEKSAEENTIEITAQSVDNPKVVDALSKTLSSRSTASRSTVSKSTVSKSTVSRSIASKSIASEATLLEATLSISSKAASPAVALSTIVSSDQLSSKQSSSGVTLLEKSPPQSASTKVEEPNARLAASIKARLAQCKIDKNLQQAEEALSSAPSNNQSPNEEKADDSHKAAPKSHKKDRPASLANKSNQQHLPKIVHIEDSLFHSRMMSPIVEKLGYRYINISDPLQALPTLLEVKPELIFLDLVMPMANGFEVCSQIRRIGIFRHTPIIIVTGNRGIVDRLRVAISGASGFMSKPIKEKKVEKILRKHVEKKA